MKLVNDGVRVVLTIKPDADPIPADTDAFVATRSAVGEQYVILRPDEREGALPQGRRRSSRRAAPSIPVPVEQLLLNMDTLASSHRPGAPARRRRRARQGLRRLRRRPRAGSIDNGNLLLARAEQSLPQTLKLITDGQTVLHDPDREPLGDPAVGRATSGWSPTPWSSSRPRPAQPRGQRARRRRGAPAAGAERRARAGLAGPQPRHPEQGHHPAAGRRRADAHHLSRRRLRRLQRRPQRQRRRCARTSGSCSTPTTRARAPPATVSTGSTPSPGAVATINTDPSPVA